MTACDGRILDGPMMQGHLPLGVIFITVKWQKDLADVIKVTNQLITQVYVT